MSILYINKNIYKSTRYSRNHNSILIIDKGCKEICDGAFANSYFETVIFKGNTCKIGKGVFRLCNNLRSVILPEKLKEIPEGMFSECGRLEDVKLPETLIKIGNYAFFKSGVKSITLPKKVEHLGKGCFESSKIYGIDLSNVKSIDEDCFAFCKNLISVKIGNQVETIPQGCFRHCNLSLCLMSSKESNYEDQYAIDAVTISESAFSYNNNLTIILPSNVVISKQAFICNPKELDNRLAYCYENYNAVKSLRSQGVKTIVLKELCCELI